MINFFYSYFLIGYYALGNSGRAIVDSSIVISQIGNSFIFCLTRKKPSCFCLSSVIHGQCAMHILTKLLTSATEGPSALTSWGINLSFFLISSEVVVFLGLHQKFYDCSRTRIRLARKTPSPHPEKKMEHIL